MFKTKDFHTKKEDGCGWAQLHLPNPLAVAHYVPRALLGRLDGDINTPALEPSSPFCGRLGERQPCLRSALMAGFLVFMNSYLESLHSPVDLPVQFKERSLGIWLQGHD